MCRTSPSACWMAFQINQSTNKQEGHTATSLPAVLHERGRETSLHQCLQKDKAGRWHEWNLPGPAHRWLVHVCRLQVPALKALISSNTFLPMPWALVPRSSAQALWNDFNSPHRASGALLPPVHTLGSMFHLPRLRESLILLIHSLDPGSQNVSRTLYPIFSPKIISTQ